MIRLDDEASNERLDFRLTLEILISFLQNNRQHLVDRPAVDGIDISVIFDLVLVFRLKQPDNFQCLRSFLRHDLSRLLPLARRRWLVLQVLARFNSADTATEVKLLYSTHLLYTLIQRAHVAGEARELVDHEVILKVRETMNEHLTRELPKTSEQLQMSIETMQLLSLLICVLREGIEEIKKDVLNRAQHFSKAGDKLLKHYSYIVYCNFIKHIGLHEANESQKFMALYVNLFKQLDSLHNFEHEIGALNKKALSILIPYWAEKNTNDEMSWLDITARTIVEDNHESNKLVRFWEIFVKNHNMFKRKRDQKF
jgi:hypothetical protein